jgi:hypothetical protein
MIQNESHDFPSLRVAFLWFGLLAVILGGCSNMSQSPDIVKVRDPGNRIYRDEPASERAKSEWEYANMSANAYRDHWTKEIPVASPQLSLIAVPVKQVATECIANSDDPLPLPGWFRWADFPEEDPALENDSNKQQLFFEIA